MLGRKDFHVEVFFVFMACVQYVDERYQYAGLFRGSMYVPLCLPFYLHLACLPIYLSIYLFFFLSIYLSVFFSSIYRSLYLSVPISIYLSPCLCKSAHPPEVFPVDQNRSPPLPVLAARPKAQSCAAIAGPQPRSPAASLLSLNCDPPLASTSRKKIRIDARKNVRQCQTVCKQEKRHKDCESILC